jgi:4-hydroxy-3-polyprenylbenzoate decarboxylase
MRTQLPEIIDMNMPAEGVFHNLVIISIEKRFPMQARRLMSALWGMGQMSFVKTIVVFDHTVDIQDTSTLLDKLFNQIDFTHDLFFSEGILDVLNHASDRAVYGSKLGIDLTEKIKGEDEFKRTLTNISSPPSLSPENIIETFTEITSCKIIEKKNNHKVALATIDKKFINQGLSIIEKFMSDDNFSLITVLVILEGHENINDSSTVMWKILNNIDPKRDIHLFKNRMGIDVTCKTGEKNYAQIWPDEITMSSQVIKTVDQKWKKMFNE